MDRAGMPQLRVPLLRAADDVTLVREAGRDVVRAPPLLSPWHPSGTVRRRVTIIAIALLDGDELARVLGIAPRRWFVADVKR